MATYINDLRRRHQTPQSEAIPGTDQVKNNAGGYVYELDCWKRLDRFLVLGSAGGTYYVNQNALTRKNAGIVDKCWQEDARRTVDAIRNISNQGRAPKNEPAILALALCCASQAGSPADRHYAYDALPEVCRIPTHLFHFIAYRKRLSGISSGLRHAIERWYNRYETADDLAYHLVKYQRRDGWSHRDVFRQAHPTAKRDLATSALFRYVAGKNVDRGSLPKIVSAMERIHQDGVSTQEIINAIVEHGLTHEMIPTSSKTNRDVWSALLLRMPLTAMIRNLGTMTRVGVFDGTEYRSMVRHRLLDESYIKRSRVHPIAILVGLKTYASGHGMRGSSTWNPIRSIIDVLDEAFYLSFGNVKPTGKRLLLACDVSGSMGSQSIAGLPLTPAEATGALSLVTLRVEDSDAVEIVGFADGLRPLPISPRQRLDDVAYMMRAKTFDKTDCALPMRYAADYARQFDGFMVLTDNETWFGDMHPIEALRRYRQKLGIPAKLCVVGMTSTWFSIAPQDDVGCLDVVGFDTATPNIINQFFGDH